MKVLHFILDGFHPSNATKLFNLENIDKVASTVGLQDYKDIQSVVTPNEHLKSVRMWFRYYSHHYVDKSDDQTHTRMRYTGLYDEVPSEELIWNKLAIENNVPSFMMPYNALATKPTTWLLGDKKSKGRKLLSGHYKNWYSKICWLLTDGKFKRVDTDYIASTLMPTASADTSIKNPKTLEMFKYIKSAPDNNEFKRRFEETYPQYVDELKSIVDERLHGNMVEWDERVLPSLQEFTNKYKDKDSYVHLGFGETDLMYHYYCYPEIVQDVLAPYLEHCLSEAIKIYQPDVVVICGDHNMVNVDNPQAERYVKSFGALGKYSGRLATHITFRDGSTTALSTAIWTPEPIFNDHGYLVGGRVYFNNEGKKFVDTLDKKVEDGNSKEFQYSYDNLFPEYFYESLSETLHNEE